MHTVCQAQNVSKKWKVFYNCTFLLQWIAMNCNVLQWISLPKKKTQHLSLSSWYSSESVSPNSYLKSSKEILS